MDASAKRQFIDERFLAPSKKRDFEREKPDFDAGGDRELCCVAHYSPAQTRLGLTTTRGDLPVYRRLPLYPYEQTTSPSACMSQRCH